MGKSQWKRKIGQTTNAILVLENSKGEIDRIPYKKKEGERRADIEKKLAKSGYKVLNVLYSD